MVGASGSAWGSAPTGLNVLGFNADVLSSALPAGAATAANQEVTAAGTSATSAQAVQGVTGGVPLPTNGANTGGSLTSIIQAGASVAINISTIGPTQLVPAVSGKTIYVTEWNALAAGKRYHCHSESLAMPSPTKTGEVAVSEGLEQVQTNRPRILAADDQQHIQRNGQQQHDEHEVVVSQHPRQGAPVDRNHTVEDTLTGPVEPSVRPVSLVL